MDAGTSQFTAAELGYPRPPAPPPGDLPPGDGRYTVPTFLSFSSLVQNASKSFRLTHERLVASLDYDPETGIFRRRLGTSNQVPGAVCGSLYDNGYVRIMVDGVSHSAHRLAWLYVHGVWPERHLDHKDNDRSNNRIANLRPATRKQNNKNARKRKDNASGYKGVSRKYGRWVVQIQVDGHKRHVGYFNDPVEAARAYDAEAIRLHGEFARTNFENSHAADARSG